MYITCIRVYVARLCAVLVRNTLFALHRYGEFTVLYHVLHLYIMYIIVYVARVCVLYTVIYVNTWCIPLYAMTFKVLL